MKFILKIVDYVIDSSLWVASSVAALTLITYLNIDFPINLNVVLLTFFGTVFGYNFVKYFKLIKGEQLKFQVSGFKFVLFSSVISLLLSGYYFFQLEIKTQLLLIFPALLTFFYTVSFGKKTLRTTDGIKIYIIAICWVFVTVVLPIIEGQWELNNDIIIELLQRFLFVIAITLPFEIRDVLNDDTSLGTMPQKIGVVYTKIVGVMLMIVFYCLEFFKDDIQERTLYVLPVIFLITIATLVFSTKNQPKYYASFFVEGIPVIWGLLMVL